jgi:hypothetical protein
LNLNIISDRIRRKEMKKKMLGIFLAIILMLVIFGYVTTSKAFFDPQGDKLVQVVYNEGDVQVAYDVGSASSLSTGYTLAGAGSISLADFSAPVEWADLKVGFYAANMSSPNGDAYFATTKSSPPAVTGNYGPFMNTAFGLNSYLNSFNSQKVVTPTSDPAGYDVKMNQNSNVPGFYGSFNSDWTDGEASLADLATEGHVDMYLWHFINDGAGNAVLQGCVGTLTVSADGSTSFKPVCPIVIDMVLNKGWSMISLPVECEDPASGNILLQNSEVIYGFEKGIGYKRITAANEMEVGKGYWILSDQDQTLNLTGKPIQSYTLTAGEDGWMMIGGCSSPAEAFTDGCNIRIIYGYDPEIGYKRLAGEDLQPEKGYWILLEDVIGQCNLTADTAGNPI